MKAAAVRKLANAWDLARIRSAIEAVTEREEDFPEIEGDDAGERLTHLLLAARIRERVEEQGEDLKDAFRAEMAAVRGVLAND